MAFLFPDIIDDFTSPVDIDPADTIHLMWFPAAPITVTAINLYAVTSPNSAGGTYLFSITGAGNNLISAATFDIESLVNVTLTPMTLTLTVADLDLAAGATVDFSFASNNADLTGAGLYAQICFRTRVT